MSVNVGEQLVASYLRFIRGCDFTQTNLQTVDSHGEIDVVGIALKTKVVYVCEVAIHLTTGLQYVKDNRPNNVQKLTDKFSRDIEYANKYLSEYEKRFMLWSPIVKDSKGQLLYNQLDHLQKVGDSIKSTYGVEIDFVVNQRFREALREMGAYARRATADLSCPVMRLLQIEANLGRHVDKITEKVLLGMP